MDIGHYFAIVIGAILINNFVLTKFLGICAFVGVSKKLDSAIGMGLAVTFVMSMSASITWVVYAYILDPNRNIFGGVDLTFLRTIAFIVVIAALVQFVEMVIQKISPVLYNALGIYLPLIATNCAVLGVTVLNVQEDLGFVDSVLTSFAAGLGFTLALILMAGLRVRMELSDIPKPLQGLPIAFVTASLMSLAFMGFSGLALK